MYTILICDDDRDIVSALDIYLTSEGYRTLKTYNGKEALKAAEQHEVHLILMDIMMPELDGIRATAKLREGSNVPIILLTAKSEDSDKILGLNIGADDYITKPFSPRVLIARIKARLRDTSVSGDEGSVVSYAGIVINSEFHEVCSDGVPLSLTANEFILLRTFLKNPGKVFSRDAIIKCVHGEGYPVTDRAVDVAVVGLRKKLGAKGALIETVRGVGYKFSR